MDIQKQEIVKIRDNATGLVLTKDSSAKYFSLYSVNSSEDGMEFTRDDLKALAEMVLTMLQETEEGIK